MINFIDYIKEFIWIKKQTKYLKEKNIYIIKLEYKNSLNIPYNNKWVAILDTEKKDLKKILQKDYTFSYRWNTNSVLFKNTKIEIVKETLKYLKIKTMRDACE